MEILPRSSSPTARAEPSDPRSTKLVPIRGLNPRPCSLRARERESLAPLGPETTRSDRHPQLSPRSRERRTLATARQRGRSDPSGCKRHGPRHFGRGPLNSPSWTRTSNLPVNSRPLYRLSYRGSWSVWASSESASDVRPSNRFWRLGLWIDQSSGFCREVKWRALSPCIGAGQSLHCPARHYGMEGDGPLSRRPSLARTPPVTLAFAVCPLVRRSPP